MVLFLVSEAVAARNSASPDGAAMTVLIGSFHLPLAGYAAILGRLRGAGADGGAVLARGRLRASARAVVRFRNGASSPLSRVRQRMRRTIGLAMIALRSLLFNLAFYVNIIVLMILGLPALLIGRHGVFFMARSLGGHSIWLLEKICGLRVEFRGLENIPQGGYILAAKHQSFLETFSLVTKTPDFSIILKKQLKYIPLFGLYSPPPA